MDNDCDDEDLDILLGMVLEEGGENVMSTLDKESVTTMLESHAGFSARLNMDEAIQDVMVDEQAELPTSDADEGDGGVNYVGSSAHVAEDTKADHPGKLKDNALSSLPEIVDFTPERGMIGVVKERLNKIILSCSNQCLGLPKDDARFIWRRLAAFVEISKMAEGEPLELGPIDISPVSKLTPFSYRCNVPFGATKLGKRSIVLIDAKVMRGSEVVCEETIKSTATALVSSWAYAENPSTYVVFLSKISNQSFEFEAPPQQLTSAAKRQDPFVAAPSAGMTLVANALTDFPDPTNITVHTNEKEDGRHGQGRGGKRSTVDEVSLGEAGTEWLDEVDRHCKVRLVESMVHVLSASDEGKTSDEQTALQSADSQIVSAVGAEDLFKEKDGKTYLKDDTLNSLSNAKLNIVLDIMLVKIVQTLMSTNCSKKELDDVLNSSGQSGLSLLHYASMYNLRSLFPILLLHGCDPQAVTDKGGLTPLHVACSSGNSGIVELLASNNVALAPKDSFGLTPADHATKNGFPNIAKWLNDKIAKDKPSSASNNDTADMETNDASPIVLELEHGKIVSDENLDDARLLMQQAFSNLSLKNKLTLNLIVEDKRKSKSTKKKLEGVSSSMDYETDSSSTTGGSVDFIPSTEKEKLDTAMSLMTPVELDELRRKTQKLKVSDLRKWMLWRNMETLMNTSNYIASDYDTMLNEAQEIKPESVAESVQKLQSINEQDADVTRKEDAQLLFKQALALMVIRKDMMSEHEEDKNNNDKASKNG